MISFQLTTQLGGAETKAPPEHAVPPKPASDHDGGFPCTPLSGHTTHSVTTRGSIRNSHRAILCRGFLFIFRRPLKRPLGPEGVTR
jgi:hypothetical protein